MLVPVAAEASADPCGELGRIFAGVERFPELDVYVHGSWADRTRTAFSDLDDLVIYNPERRPPTPARLNAIEGWLNRVDHRMAMLDPLQHHGHWIIGGWELDHLDESAGLPLSVLNGAVAIQGPQVVEARVAVEPSRRGAVRAVHDSGELIRELHGRLRDGSLNLYNAKRLVGSVALLPALVFQARGSRATKRWALENAGSLFDDHELAPLRWSTVVRAEWHQALDRRSRLALTCATRAVRDPHLYRRLAARFSPRFLAERFDPIPADALQAFLKKSEQLVASVD